MTDLDCPREQGGFIVVTDPKTGFYAVYDRSTGEPGLKLRSLPETNDPSVLARAWKAANDKARELGWIV